MNKPVSVIIPTCGALEYLKFCIKNIRQYSNPNLYRLIVINNGSTKVENFLNKEGIEHVYNSKNLGFADSVLQGEKLVNSKFIIILNDDTVVSKQWIENFISEYNKFKNYGVRLIGPLKPSKLFTHPYFNTNSRNVLERVKLFEKNNKPQELLRLYCGTSNYNIFVKDFLQINCKKGGIIKTPPQFLSGYCIFGETNFFRKIGGIFDTNFKLYGSEDVDLSWRIAALGFKNMRTNKIYVHHFEGVSVRKNKLDVNVINKKNNLIFYKKWNKLLWNFIEKEKNAGKNFEEIISSYWFLKELINIALEFASIKEIPATLVNDFLQYKKNQ